MTIWIVGRQHPCDEHCPGAIVMPRWELLGAYRNETQAVARCKQSSDFVAPAELDVDAPEETVEWPGLFFPLATRP